MNNKHAIDFQTLCPAPARYRPVPAAQPGGGKQMICYSEKVQCNLICEEDYLILLTTLNVTISCITETLGLKCNTINARS